MPESTKQHVQQPYCNDLRKEQATHPRRTCHEDGCWHSLLVHTYNTYVGKLVQDGMCLYSALSSLVCARLGRTAGCRTRPQTCRPSRGTLQQKHEDANPTIVAAICMLAK